MTAVSTQDVDELQQRVDESLRRRAELGEELEALEEQNFSYRNQLAESQRVEREAKADKLASAMDICCFLASANGNLRAELCKLFVRKRKLALELHALTKRERGRIERALAQPVFSHPILEGKEMPYDKCPIPPAQLIQQWQKVAEASTSTIVHDGHFSLESIVNALDASRSLFDEAQSRIIFADAHKKDELVWDNFGFSLGVRRDYSYEFDEPDSPENLQWHTTADELNQTIKAATLAKLVERATHEVQTDVKFRYTFLLTHTSFSTSEEILALLQSRFYVPTPPNMTKPELEIWKERKLSRIQIRVFSVLKYWLEEHWQDDFAGNDALTRQLEEMLAAWSDEKHNPLSVKLCKQLETIMLRKKAQKERQVTSSAEAPKLLIKPMKSLSGFKFVDANETEIARQLTLRDHAVFSKIIPREFLGQAWSKKDKAKRAPHIVAMIEQFNKVCSWSQLEILGCENLQKRARMLQKWLLIASECWKLNNFNSLYAIYCGLNANPVHRLKQTWALVRTGPVQRFAEIQALFSPERNSKAFRDALRSALTPCIPHLGIFLADLVFIEDGNPQMVKNRINFYKRTLLGERIAWIKQYQMAMYHLTEHNIVQQYFDEHMRVMDEEDLWKLSQSVESRQKAS